MAAPVLKDKCPTHTSLTEHGDWETRAGGEGEGGCILVSFIPNTAEHNLTFGFCMGESSGHLSEAFPLAEQGWSFPLMPHTTSFPLFSSCLPWLLSPCRACGWGAFAQPVEEGRRFRGPSLFALPGDRLMGVGLSHGYIRRMELKEGYCQLHHVSWQVVVREQQNDSRETVQLCSHAKPEVKSVSVFRGLSYFLKAWAQRLPIPEGWCFLSSGLFESPLPLDMAMAQLPNVVPT